MGIRLGSIIPARPVKIAQLRGQRLAVDGYNLLYQFLASIRQRDGMPLADAHGHTTSHLSGLLFRLSALAAEGLRFCLIFDGKPHALKKRVLDERRDRKIKAQAEWEAALAAGDLVKARTKAQQTSQLTPEMVTEAQELLDALGLPWVTAPSEGEAQAAAMMAAGVVDAAVSQDFDTLLFGAPRLLRNLTVSGRRKLPGRQAWVEVNPEELTLAGAIEATQLSHEQLVDMAILMGTDFNPGIHGIGPKKGLKLLRELGSAEAALAKLGHKVDNLDELRQLFLNHPSVDFAPTWGEPRRGRVMELLCERHGFELASPADDAQRGSQVSYRHEHAWPICQAMIARGVIGDFRAPDIFRCGFSPLYLSHAEVARAVEILSEVMESDAWHASEHQARRAVT